MSKRIVEKTIRRQEDPVTHEMIETELTPLQLAYERACGGVERELCRLPATADQERLVRWLQAWLLKMVKHTD